MVRSRIWIACLLPVLALAACKSPRANHVVGDAAGPEALAAPAHDRPATTLARAIELAQKSVPDGRFLRAEIEEEDGKTICSVILASGDGQREVDVDAASGTLLATEKEELEPEADEVLAAIGTDPAHAPIGAAKAIEAAAAKLPNAWASAVSLELPEGGLTYVVVMIEGEKARAAQVSATDGTVRTISALEEESEELTEPPTVSLASAIELARKKAPTAAFIHAELGLESEHANCLVCFWEQPKLHLLEIDAESGAVLADDASQSPESEDRERLQKALERPDAPIDPAQAIASSIAAVPGSWARLIDLDCDAVPLAYVVEVVAGKVVKEVRIGALDGTLLSVHDYVERGESEESEF